jgi:hypothetical protein
MHKSSIGWCESNKYTITATEKDNVDIKQSKSTPQSMSCHWKEQKYQQKFYKNLFVYNSFQYYIINNISRKNLFSMLNLDIKLFHKIFNIISTIYK